MFKSKPDNTSQEPINEYSLTRPRIFNMFELDGGAFIFRIEKREVMRILIEKGIEEWWADTDFLRGSDKLRNKSVNVIKTDKNNPEYTSLRPDSAWLRWQVQNNTSTAQWKLFRSGTVEPTPLYVSEDKCFMATQETSGLIVITLWRKKNNTGVINIEGTYNFTEGHIFKSDWYCTDAFNGHPQRSLSPRVARS